MVLLNIYLLTLLAAFASFACVPIASRLKCFVFSEHKPALFYTPSWPSLPISKPLLFCPSAIQNDLIEKMKKLTEARHIREGSINSVSSPSCTKADEEVKLLFLDVIAFCAFGKLNA